MRTIECGKINGTTFKGFHPIFCWTEMIRVKRMNVFSKTHSWGKIKKLTKYVCVCILRLFVQECVRKAKEIKVRVAIGSEGKCQKFILMDKLYLLLPACATNEKRNGRQLFCLHFLHANKCQEYFMHWESYALKFGRHFFFFDHQTDATHNVRGTSFFNNRIVPRN